MLTKNKFSVVIYIDKNKFSLITYFDKNKSSVVICKIAESESPFGFIYIIYTILIGLYHFMLSRASTTTKISMSVHWDNHMFVAYYSSMLNEIDTHSLLEKISFMNT